MLVCHLSPSAGWQACLCETSGDAGCTSVQLDTGTALEGKQGKWGKAPCAIHRNRALRLPALRVEIAPRQQAGASSAFCLICLHFQTGLGKRRY